MQLARSPCIAECSAVVAVVVELTMEADHKPPHHNTHVVLVFDDHTDDRLTYGHDTVLLSSGCRPSSAVQRGCGRGRRQLIATVAQVAYFPVLLALRWCHLRLDYMFYNHLFSDPQVAAPGAGLPLQRAVHRRPHRHEPRRLHHHVNLPGERRVGLLVVGCLLCPRRAMHFI